ncbi:helix-turn-helix domain-containing protein, partial [Kribbella sp. NPDC050470]|uniref:helix-turn-helix domain-containing protein n=2 Tax=unclassified Kribbella TaxID=2644121 RepID=UPI0037B8D547
PNVAHMQLNTEALKALRTTGGDSQKSLAERAGISEYALNQIELGKSKPRDSTIKKLADALSVPVGALSYADEREAS